MDKRFETPSSPFTHSGASTQRIMLDVILSLLPATVAAVLIFGAKALTPILSCVIAAVVSEFLFNVITHRKQSVGDLSAIVTGLLLGLNLSTNVPVWQCVLGSVFAIVVVKCLFGGLGHNFANPAITACSSPLRRSPEERCRRARTWSLSPLQRRLSCCPPVRRGFPR